MQTEFKPVISRVEGLCLAFGAMVGWGWVALAGRWVEQGGAQGSVFAFLLGGLMMLFIGFTYAELASAMPKVGGEHVYSERALGRISSFICTWAITLAYVSVSAFEAVALPTVAEYLVPNLKQIYLYTIAGYDVYLSWALVGAVGAAAVVWLNILGIKVAARFQLWATAILVVVGAVLMFGAMLNPTDSPMPAYSAPMFSGMALVLLAVPFMFVGFDVIPQAAEEMDMEPRRIGGLIILSVLLATAWYALICFAVGRALPFDLLTPDSLGTVVAATAAWESDYAGLAVVLAGILGIITSWNAVVMGGARAIFVMARSGQLPAWLGVLHPTRRTPINALIAIGVVCVIAPFFGRPMLVWLVDAGSFNVVIAYFFVALSFIVLRLREPEMLRPMRVRFGMPIGIFALISSMFLMVLYLPGGAAALIWPYEWIIVGLWWLIGAICLFTARGEVSTRPVAG